MARKLLFVLAAGFLLTLATGQLPTELETIVEEELVDTISRAAVGEVEFSSTIDNQKPSGPLLETATSTMPDGLPYRVVRVIDGDTIVIDRDSTLETIRLIGIDTPETVHPSKAVQCFGAEASAQTKAWLENASVVIETDPGEGEYDKYRRRLGYVYRTDGLFVNLELIRQGYAYEYTYDTPYRYQVEFQAAEAAARAARTGLWGEAACATG